MPHIQEHSLCFLYLGHFCDCSVAQLQGFSCVFGFASSLDLQHLTCPIMYLQCLWSNWLLQCLPLLATIDLNYFSHDNKIT